MNEKQVRDALKREVSKKIIFARPDDDEDYYRLHGIVCACINHLANTGRLR